MSSGRRKDGQGSRDGDPLINPGRDEGITVKNEKSDSKVRKVSGTCKTEDVKKAFKAKMENASPRLLSLKIKDIKTRASKETSRSHCLGVVQMFEAITQSHTKMLKLVDHLPNEKHGIECSECITFGDNMIDEFETFLTSIFKFTTLAVDEPPQLSQTLKDLKRSLQSLFVSSEQHNTTCRKNVQKVLQEIYDLCNKLYETMRSDISHSLSYVTMSKSVSVETLFLRSEHPYFTCVGLLTAELQKLESGLQRFKNIQSCCHFLKELNNFALSIESVNEVVLQASYLHIHGLVYDIKNVMTLGKVVRICSELKKLFESNATCKKECLELHEGVQTALNYSLLSNDCIQKVGQINNHIQRSHFSGAVQWLNELETSVIPAVDYIVEQNSLKLREPFMPLHLEKYKELLEFTEEYLSKIISYFLEQKEDYPTFTDASLITAELQNTLRTDFMKLNVTYIITLLERGFNTDQASYTDTDLSDVNTLGEDCKRSLQAMPCQVFEPCDAIYKELRAEENLQKMNHIWEVCKMIAYMLIKFDKATGDGDLIRNMDALIELVKEHLSFCILAIESKSSVSDHERTDFKSEYENVISNLLSTITSKMAKSAQKNKTSGNAATLVAGTILPGQQKDYCVVDFYVVIQRSIWKIKGSPKMFMRFLIPIDDNYTKVETVVVGPLQVEREASDICAMQLRLYLSVKLIGHQISYKYQIYSHEIITTDEFIFCEELGENMNCYRILNLPWDKDEKTKVYNGCVYPIESEDQNIAKKFLNIFVSSSNLKIPDRSNELETCFVAYLEDIFDSIIQSGFSNWTMVHNDYHTIQTVYRELDSAKIKNIHTLQEVQLASRNKCKKILCSNLMDLIQKSVIQPYRPERIFSFLLLCRCFTDLMKVDKASELLSLLPNDMKYKTEYKMLQTSINSIKDSQQYFHAMKVVIKTSMKSGALRDPSWVKAFPLYSWFCSSQKLLPNETLDWSLSSITEKLKSLDGLFGSLHVEEKTIEGVLNGLNHSLLEVDPMLRLALFRICPESKYSLLIPYVPVPVILTGISIRIESLEMNLTSEMLRHFVVFLTTLLSEERNLNQHVAVANSVSCIVTSLDKSESLQRIYNRGEFDTFVILCAKVTTLMYQHAPEELKENRYQDFIPLISKWSSACFGECFVESEHNFWLKLNSSIKSEEWEHILQKIIQYRIEKLKSFSDRVKVFESLQSNEDVTDFVIIAIEKVIETTMSNVPTKELENLAKGRSTKSIMLLCSLMERKFYINSLSLEDILSWDLWPAVLKAHHDSKQLSTYSHNLCECVISTVKSLIYETLKSGEVSIEKLCYLEEHSSIIIEISNVLSLETTIFNDNMKDLQKRKKVFLMYVDLCTHFISTFAPEYEAMNTVLDSVKLEQSRTSINDLCQLDGDEWIFPIFGDNAPPTDMVVQYAVMKSSAHSNDLFHKEWQASRDLDATTDVYYDIWMPLFTFYENLVHKLRNKTITLNEMGSLFGGSEWSENKSNIEKLVAAVSKCTSKQASNIEWLASKISWSSEISIADRIANILPSQPDDARWISQLADEIRQWSTFQQLSPIADVLLDTLQNLNVEKSMYEDFELFSTESIQKLQEKQLGNISKEIEEVLSFLKEYCLQQSKTNITAIQKIAEYKELREWIRSKSEDYNEMQTFIEVAMDTTAGEGDEIQDRLSDLSDLCGKFSPIIFKLEAVESLQALLKLFRDTWDLIKSLRDPISTVNICNGNLQWYLQIGELQGSVERGTKKQLEDINKYGEYHILSSEDTQECVLLLEIESTEEQIPQKRWTLEDLLELESKLVLITRPNSPWEKDKSKFQAMLNGVIRMKETIQKLKEYGYLGQLDSDYTLRCVDFSEHLEKLNKMTQDFETTLVEWIKYVWNCRHTYYQLNFYTTKQLITLRKEITQIRDDKSNSKEINPHVFHLLQSVIGKPDNSSMLLRKALNNEEDDTVEEEKETISIEAQSEESPSPVKVQDELTFLQKAISGLDTEKNKLFEQLKQDSYHDDQLLLEAVLNPECCNDFTTAMTWCDEMACDDDYMEEIRCKWKVNITNENIPEEPNQPVYEQPKDDESPTETSNFSVIADAFIPFKHYSTVYQKRGICEDSKNIISLKELGSFLQNIVKGCAKRTEIALSRALEEGTPNKIVTSPKTALVKRSFSRPLEEGTPNLIVTSPSDIFLSLLQIYKKDKEEPLPGFEEVLLCSTSSSLEEVVVFWMRALFDEDRGRIYCLVHAEKLSYLVAEKAMDILKFLSQGRKYYRLIIICSSEGEEKSHIIHHLFSYRRPLNPPSNDDMKGIEEYLRYHITQQLIEEAQPQNNRTLDVYASCIDESHSQIRIVTSYQSGVGKSLYIRRMKDKLTRKLKDSGKISDKKSAIPIITVPLHGPVVTSDEILSILQEQTGLKQGSSLSNMQQDDENMQQDLKTNSSDQNMPKDVSSSIIHLDVPQKVLKSIDDLLFSLLILKGLSNSSGQIWRCLPTQLYAIEITLPSDHSYLLNYPEVQRVLTLLQLLPSVTCVGPYDSAAESLNSIVPIDFVEVQTPMYQRVYQYLEKLDSDSKEELETFSYMGILNDDYSDLDCIRVILRHTGLKHPTWKEVRHFVWFLNVQLNACEESSLMRRVKGLKSFAVEFMKIMSRDFATSSMTNDRSGDILEQHKIKKNWGKSMHPYLFFNKDRYSISHIGLALHKTSGTHTPVIVDSSTGEKINIVTKQEVFSFLENQANVPTYPLCDVPESALVRKLAAFVGIKKEEGKEVEKPDDTYVLTNDNLIKIMGIQMRFRCRIPVVLMGETGCGKTHLIRFMCKFAAYGKNLKNMFIVKVHGGTTEEDVIKCLHEAIDAAMINRLERVETVVFFDEANTSEVISLIKEIMCDGRYKGITFPPFLKFVAACNPYRRHSDKMIKKLKGAGLGWHDCDSKNTAEKIGDIPLRDLVYRVHDLPASMRALVYDFGSLSNETEKDYIRQIVRNRIEKLQSEINEDMMKSIADVLCNCQSYMKGRDDECSFVSLRDVERIMLVFGYFLETYIPAFKLETGTINKETWSLVLAIGVCYHAKMEKRSDFEEYICKEFCPPLTEVTNTSIQNIIKKSQEALLYSMIIQDNIARNKALRENIFMMFVCIELRMPLFLVGKPGSSKSLAKTIIQASMRGEHSKTNMMRKFKQVHIHSHQCSPLSTPASITEVFVSAKKYQTKKDTKSFVSVVVLDEVGLAEASPYLPLKALHPLLEDGTEGSGSDDKRVERDQRVAFIGISNWALDPAKMNRGIMVTRGDPNITDLTDSAKGICSNIKGEDGNVLKRLEKYFSAFATGYNFICSKQKREFYGLRDFYSLIKMLCWMSQKSGTDLTKAQLEHAIKRNFSGYSESDIKPYEKFMSLLHLQNTESARETKLLKLFKNQELVSLTNKMTGEFVSMHDGKLQWCEQTSKNAQFIVHVRRGMISLQNVADTEYWITISGQHLTCTKSKQKFCIVEHQNDLTSICNSRSSGQSPVFVELDGVNYFFPVIPNDPETNPDNSPLGLIKRSLITVEKGHGESRYLLFLTENYSAVQTLKNFVVTNCLSLNKMDSTEDEDLSKDALEPFVLFGSSFPKDSEYAQVCRNISEIRLCMEAGRMVILLNLENLYESLYDVLNQYYIESGGHRYVDLGLRAHRMKCRVHENFKLILIAEREKVYNEFPTPLINRLEKHFVTSKTVLRDWQQTICSELQEWVKTFVNTESGFQEENVFVGYNPDTAAAVVLQASADLEDQTTAIEGSDVFKKEILDHSKQLLLQLATPDSIIRATGDKVIDAGRKLHQIYFMDQQHSSLSALITVKTGSLLQVTTHSPSLLQEEIEQLRNDLEIDESNIDRHHLESFQTEQEFLDNIDKAIEKGRNEKYFLILECDSGHLNGNLISCCRYRIVDKYYKARDSSTCIILLIHLPRKYPTSNFVSFQSQPWQCCHIDDITESSISVANLVINNKPLSEVFYSDDEEYEEVSHVSSRSLEELYSETSSPPSIGTLVPQIGNNMCRRLHYCIHDALSKIKAVQSTTQRLEILKRLIIEKPILPLQDQNSFYAVIVKLIKKILQEQEKGTVHSAWIIDEARNIKNLQDAGTLRNALIRRFDYILAPVLSEIIAFVDQYCNLDLLESPGPMSDLWLRIFRSDELCQTKLCQLASTSKAKHQGHVVNKESQKSEFPFSWIIYSYVKEIMDATGARKNDVDMFRDGALEQILKETPSDCVKDLLPKYIHDFIQLTQASIQITQHYELLQTSIRLMIQETMPNLDQVTLLEGIITVHQQYKEKQKLFEWFSKLISQMPRILDGIKNNQSPHIEDLVETAVHEAVHNTSLSEPLSQGTTAALRTWIHKQYEIHQIINSILDHMHHRESVGRIIQKWQWICTTRMFVENVVLKNEKAMVFFAKNLQMYSEKEDELQTGLAFKKVAILLNNVENCLQSGKVQVPPEQKYAIHNSCWTFFIEVLSEHCFGLEYTFPDRALVSRLLDSVFPLSSIKRSEPVMHKFLQYHTEKSPQIQSIMVKMLLRYELIDVEDFLSDIITRIDEDKLSACMQQKDVASLMIEYFKDQLAIKSFGEDESGNWTRFTEILIQGHSDFMSSKTKPIAISPDCLNAVAQMSFSMHQLALLINSHYIYTDLEDDADIKYFVDTAEQLLSEHSTFTGFLTRFVVRHFGVSLLIKTSELNNFKWILPLHELKQESYHFIDPAAIYNPVYEGLRAALSSASTGDIDISELQQKSVNLKQIDIVPLALAFYERVRLSHVSGLPSKVLNQEAIMEFVNFVEHCKLFTDYDEIVKTVRALIYNNQCTGFDLMQARKPETPEERLVINEQDLIRTIIVHSVLAVLTNRRDKLIKVLFALLTAPETLKDTLLPAMALNIPRRVSDGEKFPKCSSGHRHSSIMVGQLCPHCGNMIHESIKKMPAVQKPVPKPIGSSGYIPGQKRDISSPIGHLSSASYSIIRIIIHSCLLWGKCNEKDVMTLTNEELADDIPTYFWEQVKCDLDSLCKATGRSIDEVALITHLVLREITQKDHGIQKSLKNLDKLTSQEDRVLWEREFDDDYIKPVLEDVDSSLQHMLQILTVRDHNKLFAAVYEINTPSNGTNFLWRFYPQVSLDHFLFNTINLQLRIEHPVIYMYLTELQSLKATQFIPDIVQLQKLIQEIISQEYDESTKDVIENMTFTQFTEKNPNDTEKCYQLLSSLQQAWTLSRHNLFTYDRLDVPKEYIFDEITDDIQMVYLIPTTYGKGVITTALVDFLVNIHNGFIIQSREFVEESLKRKWLWPVRKVQMMNVEPLHLVDCDKKFLTLLYSHCTRTFRSGSCQIEYDVAGLEKELVLNYVMGKPTITSVSGIPKLVWQKTVQKALTIRGVQKHVPQKPLTQQAKAEILSELKTTSLLTPVRDIAEIVMRLLQRRGINPKKKLREFIEKDLRMVGRLRSEKVSDYCYLEHVVSLWKLISVERTRISVRNNESEPFDDNIPIWFTDELRNDEASNQILSLEKALSKMTKLESLLEVMFEFIQVQSSMQYYCNEEESSKSLRDELQRFVEQTGSETIPHLKDIFPADITVSQVVATWKSIVKHQDSLKKQNY